MTNDMEAWGAYSRAKEPGMREKAYVWKTAIGLQKVASCTFRFHHRRANLFPSKGNK